ncbi:MULTISPECIES: hypothetical protein [unclassified Rhodococcus (in: high G+C Gram-positive bacteria)]|uniref:hypothetical protein n=1 Tax=unclassified Rhodococcus (in: high G+C Gram-positive bacteria) TaxID=192944 RepID=UPI000B9C0AFB|nr:MULTISPECIES: hypothetical protein [unclassified Rhodococcus (in: high G+C Gram-positive bacteria)]OZE40002.1 hypothetical protein CH259_04925 [Rhodococcus sp. 05-2254-4]OZE49570.1 hypothetical protein CH261_03360 [Rhodococcus sp. 05-2254-3]OZE50208.1 hypothetical protein CH283_10665 [Rhodococcus sp. 05-2254-2]
MSAVDESPWAVRDASHDVLLGAVNSGPLAGLREVQVAFDGHAIRSWPDGAGGVYVVIESVQLGPAWAQETSWLGFTINYLYPDADTYPHYVRADLSHVDGNALVVPFHLGNTFQDRAAVMVSRSSPQRVTGLNTAARKALSVLTFIQSQPVDRGQAA